MTATPPLLSAKDARIVPAALAPFAQVLTPFLVLEPNKPMAHAEIVVSEPQEPRE